MPDDKPLVTIIIGCYNHSKYVKDALNSVLNQNYKGIQVIIFDDASPDHSSVIIEEWLKQNGVNWLFFKNETNVGLHSNLKKAFDCIEGKYFTLMSADDLLMPESLALQVSTIENCTDDYGLVYGDSCMIDADGKIVIQSMFKHYQRDMVCMPSGNIFSEVVKDFYFFLQASLIRTNSFLGLNYTFRKDILSEDWDMQLAITRKFKAIGCSNTFASYRYLENSITRTLMHENKRYSFFRSHSRMLLSYYRHPLNSAEDKKAIFDRVWRIFKALSTMTSFTHSERNKFCKEMMMVYDLNDKFHLMKKITGIYSRRLRQYFNP